MTTKITGDIFNLTAHDSGYPYWIPFVKQYFEDLGIEIRKVPFSELNLSKPWILSLPPNSWKWREGDIGDLLDYFEPEVKNELIKGNGYLLINHEAESFTESSYRDIHMALSKSLLDPKKVIYLVGAINPEDEYKKFADSHRIPVEKQIKIMSSFHVHRRGFPLVSSNIEQSRINVTKDKKFLSLNRIPRWHRVAMVSMLAKHDLIDQGYVSLGLYPDDQDHARFGPTPDKIQQYTRLYSDIHEGFQKILPNLPLKVDDVDLHINQYNITSLPSMFYDKTYFSLVSSTMALKNDEPCVGYTEKEMRPILYKQPFLMHNLPYALKHLRKMGFLTFDRWFDESYDTEVHDLARLEKLVLEVKRLCSLSNEQWDKMLEEMQPVLLHNYNILIKYNKEHIFFHSDLKDLIHYVA